VTILVVEDNAVTRQIVRLSLAAQGYKILEAEDGRTAISKLAEHHPDLIIQDLALPDIDGLTLAQTLHALPGREDIPIVAFSAFVERLEEARASKDIFRAFIPKPIEPSKLVALVKRLLPAPVSQVG
jgi:two-component system sensor histidine kinase/response regulator